MQQPVTRKSLRFLIVIGLALAYIAPAQAQCVGVLPRAGSGGGGMKFGLPFPRTPNNFRMLAEMERMDQLFGLGATELYINGDMNAYSHPDHGVSLGQSLHDGIFQKAANLDGNIYGCGWGFVIAHEFAHQFQFKKLDADLDAYSKDPLTIELQADLLGAYHLGLRLREQSRDPRFLLGQDPDEFFEKSRNGARTVAFDIGTDDSRWGQVRTHGTKSERRAAVEAGSVAGWEGKFGQNFRQFEPDKPGYTWMNAQIKKIRNR